jgi:hypothetical protein
MFPYELSLFAGYKTPLKCCVITAVTLYGTTMRSESRSKFRPGFIYDLNKPDTLSTVTKTNAGNETGEWLLLVIVKYRAVTRSSTVATCEAAEWQRSLPAVVCNSRETSARL